MAGIAKALLIGNSDYSDPNIKPLLAPKNDIMRLATVLQREDIAGFETDPVFDVDLQTARKKISAFFKNADVDDLLLFYFAGHGIRDGGRNLYLALPETDLEYVEATGLSARFLLDCIKNSPSNKKVVILDCCHAGAVFKDADGELQCKDAPHDPGYIGEQLIGEEKSKAKGSGAHILAACGASQSAFEKILTVGGKKKSASLYTKLLTEGIETGKAAPDAENIMVSDIHRYVSEKRAKKGGVVTEPVKAEPEGAASLVLCKNPNVRRPLPRVMVDDLHSSNVTSRRGAIRALNDIAMGKDKHSTTEVLALFADRLDESKIDCEDNFRVRRDLEDAINQIQHHLKTVDEPTSSTKPEKSKNEEQMEEAKSKLETNLGSWAVPESDVLVKELTEANKKNKKSYKILAQLTKATPLIAGFSFLMSLNYTVEFVGSIGSWISRISNVPILAVRPLFIFTLLGSIAIFMKKAWPAWFFLIGCLLPISILVNNWHLIDMAFPHAAWICANLWCWKFLRERNKVEAS